MKNLLFVLCIWVFSYTNTNAQSVKAQTSQSWPVKIAILDESITYPSFNFLRYDYNPAIMIGTEYLLREKKYHDWYLGGNIGYYHHVDWQSAIFLNGETGWRFKLNRFNLSPSLGVGYAHVFHPGSVYQFTDNGLEEKADLGSPALTISASIQLAYQLNNNANSPEVYLAFMSMGELPFTIFTGLHQFVGLGCKFYPFTSSTIQN